MLKRTKITLLTAFLCLTALSCKPGEFIVYEFTIDRCNAQNWQFPEKAGDKATGLIEKNHVNQPDNCPRVITYRVEKGEHCSAALNYIKIVSKDTSCQFKIAVSKKLCSRTPNETTDEGALAAETIIKNLTSSNSMNVVIPEEANKKVYQAIDESNFKELIKSWCNQT